MVYFTRPTVLLYMLMALPSVCNAQACHYKISGKVLDEQHHAVPGVIVRLLNDSLGAATDTGGMFSIAGVCLGRHAIAFGAISYKTISFTVNVDGDKDLKIVLSSGDNTLGEVVVNGNKVPADDLHTVSQIELQGLALEQTRGGTLGEH